MSPVWQRHSHLVQVDIPTPDGVRHIVLPPQRRGPRVEHLQCEHTGPAAEVLTLQLDISHVWSLLDSCLSRYSQEMLFDDPPFKISVASTAAVLKPGVVDVHVHDKAPCGFPSMLGICAWHCYICCLISTFIFSLS